MSRYLCVLLLCAGSLLAQPKPAGKLAPLEFLVGEWVGGGQGQPGTGAGVDTFTKDLDGQILTRRSRSEYPATKERPAFVHTDLMVVFPSADGLRASYFDNEGHVIQYRVDAGPGTATFVSDPEPGTPRFRLVYSKEQDRLRVKFEIAPPGQPDAFKTYVEGVSTRRVK